jgi:hypothetical protein
MTAFTNLFLRLRFFAAAFLGAGAAALTADAIALGCIAALLGDAGDACAKLPPVVM